MDSSVVDFVPYSPLVGTLKEIYGLSYKDVIEKKIDSVEDACAFYHGYSRAVGFGVRFSKKIYNNEGRITSSVWVLEKEGPCLTYEYMVNQKKVTPKLEFTHKDMYNLNDAKRWDEAFENDSHAALMYLQSRANSETNFYYRFSTDEKDRLANIFWSDSYSLFEY
ncbi:hypothetical protein Ddye_008906 [Dipteronia dyeriana]|uniref:Uncharacterized protein n=1 Tax=Dipteronia dyeriana TaxID=168575 RepID=A0AAE0CLV2_9ROSI|nr:hypothetical protein Ddye_008906 [Dipteronia dyeriana]